MVDRPETSLLGSPSDRRDSSLHRWSRLGPPGGLTKTLNEKLYDSDGKDSIFGMVSL
jgi:hypothetical protein